MAITGTFLADFTNFQAAVSKAEVSLKSFEIGAGKVEKSLNRVTNSLSGTKIIQEATIAAQAVDKIGGVSKLTESELRRVGTTATEAAAKLKAMGQDVPQGIQKIADAASNLTPKLSMADKAAGLLRSTFAQFTAASLAASLIQKATASVGEFVATGAKLPALEQSFGRLTASMGEDSALMLRNLQTATRGLVSNYDLMASANKAMLLGLPVTAQSMGELAKTATVLGKAMGQDATKSLDDLIIALGRSSPRILDNLGLMVDVGEANEAYAKKLGKSVEAMTEAEKKMAFYEAAMEAARRKTEELGEQTRTFGEIATSVWVSVGNSISKSIADINVGLGAQADALLRLLHLKGLLDKQNADNVASEANWTDGLKVSKLQLVANAIGLGQYVQSLEFHAKAARASADAQQQFNTMIASAKKSTPALPTQPAIGAAAGSGAIVASLGPEAAKAAADALKAAADATKKFREEERKFNEQSAALIASREKYVTLMRTTTDLVTKASRSSVDMRVSQAGLNAELHQGAEVWLLQQKVATSTAHVFGGELIPQLSQATLAMAGFGGWTKKAATSLKDDLLVTIQAIPQTLVSAFTGGGGFKGAASAMGSMLGATIGKSVGAGIKALGKFGGPIGEAIGSLAGPLMEKLFSLFGNATKSAINKAFGDYGSLRGQLNTLTGAAKEAGDALWIQLTQRTGKNDTNTASRLIQEINTLLSEQKGKLAETSGKVAGLVNAYLGASGQVTPAMQSMIDKLVEMGGLTAENAREMLGLASAAGPSFADVKSAADKLGISLDGIGGKISNLAFAEKVGEVTGALETLELAGADMGEVYKQSVAKIQPLVSEALKFGKEMPESMRPTLQKMIDMGLLTDDTGTKLKDLTGVNFAEPLSKKFDDLIVKLGELVDAILGPKGVGAALDDIGRRVVTPRVRVIYDDDGSAPPVYPQAKGGDYWVTKPTMFLAGEAGPERATFTPGGQGGGGDGYAPVTLNIDGEAAWYGLMRVAKRKGWNG